MSKEYVRCTGGARTHLLAPGGITATVSKGGARHGGSENRLKTKIAALLGRAQKPTKTTYCATRRKSFICECARGTVSQLPLALRSRSAFWRSEFWRKCSSNLRWHRGYALIYIESAHPCPRDLHEPGGHEQCPGLGIILYTCHVCNVMWM